MPFTLAHAAAAIPFRRSRLIHSAIVMGCFAPDFPHLLSLSSRMLFGHTFAGMFVFDLPLAIAALWLFHSFIKQPMLIFLPVGIRSRLRSSANTFRFWPWERLSLIVLSILIGTATHIFWDAFTHPGSWIYRHWAFLRGSFELPVTGEIQAYKLLEYVSSIFGVAVLAVWIWGWYGATKSSATPVAEPMNAAQNRTFVASLPVLATFGGALLAYHNNGIQVQIRSIVHFTADMLISAITFFLLGLLVFGVIGRCKPASVRI
jgi:hypothetical protein